MAIYFNLYTQTVCVLLLVSSHLKQFQGKGRFLFCVRQRYASQTRKQSFLVKKWIGEKETQTVRSNDSVVSFFYALLAGFCVWREEKIEIKFIVNSQNFIIIITQLGIFALFPYTHSHRAFFGWPFFLCIKHTSFSILTNPWHCLTFSRFIFCTMCVYVHMNNFIFFIHLVVNREKQFHCIVADNLFSACYSNVY